MEDDAFQKDRMVGWACFRLDRLPNGIELLTLRAGEDTGADGRLLVTCNLRIT